MATSTRPHIQQTLANTFGTLGYLSLMLQWTWSLVILFYPFITNRDSFLFRRETPPVAPVSPIVMPTHPVISILLITITILILIFAVITILRLPKTIGKTGAQLTRATSAALLPALVQHKKISKKQHVSLSYRTTLALKLLATIVPLIVLLFAPAILAMPGIVIWTIAGTGGIGTAFFFILQILVVEVFKVSKPNVW